MSRLVIRGPASVSGTVNVPGDKSISHRALMLASAASGQTTIRDLAPGADVDSTAGCMSDLGALIERNGTVTTIDANGIANWVEPVKALDCGNSGTTIRLLAGLVAQRDLTVTLDGDSSLRARPMERVARPLRAFGAEISTTDGHAPITVSGGALTGTRVDTGVASAQVKSALMFAALGADGTTTVIEPAPTRDHTERMLTALGARIVESRTGDRHTIEVGPYAPPPFELKVPGDVSSAAFLVAAAVMTGSVLIEGVGLNPLRIGFLEAVREMGGSVTWTTDEERMNEPVGNITAERSSLRALTLEGSVIPTIHDELPLIAILATQAAGETVVRGAGELRVKEADRITTVVDGLRRFGADVEELPDGFVVRGPTELHGASVEGHGDHRVAMAFAIAGVIAKGETTIDGFECADISWPNFTDVLSCVGVEVELT
ncbi:MAG: 3-phosphoshikimate 1-carboxyvinyltransferase [Actinomycetota bacterium]